METNGNIYITTRYSAMRDSDARYLKIENAPELIELAKTILKKDVNVAMLLGKNKSQISRWRTGKRGDEPATKPTYEQLYPLIWFIACHPKTEMAPQFEVKEGYKDTNEACEGVDGDNEPLSEPTEECKELEVALFGCSEATFLNGYEVKQAQKAKDIVEKILKGELDAVGGKEFAKALRMEAGLTLI